ncbi:MAG: hypothetical protein JWM30_3769 [Burkholderia sp.]|nr:hypothetical protein [Burkholderia sp.]
MFIDCFTLFDLVKSVADYEMQYCFCIFATVFHN